jgi:cell division protease FtsH
MAQPELESRLRVFMGGFASERVVLGDISSGAENDLQKASELAFKMVAHFGMSERVGPVFHEHRNEHPFLGQTLATEGGTSDATVHVIEEETRELLLVAVEGAKRMVIDHREALDRLVDVLLEKESVEKEELLRVLGPAVTDGHAHPAEEPLHARALKRLVGIHAAPAVR